MPGNYTFDRMFQAVIDARAMRDLPADRQTSLMAKCISIYETEKDRPRRLKEWNDKQRAANAGK